MGKGSVTHLNLDEQLKPVKYFVEKIEQVGTIATADENAMIVVDHYVKKMASAVRKMEKEIKSILIPE